MIAIFVCGGCGVGYATAEARNACCPGAERCEKCDCKVGALGHFCTAEPVEDG